MNAARLKWLALLAAMFVVSYAVSHYRSNTVREYVTSASVYWRADQAVIAITTGAEVRSEGLIPKALSLVRSVAKLPADRPEIRVGAARVFTFHNGAWNDVKLSPMASPISFPLWPYNSHFYTWDKRQRVSEWNGYLLVPVSPRRAAELREAFPDDPANYLPAGSGKLPQTYDVLQDVITRDEWHSYQHIASQPEGKQLAFPVGDKTFQIVVQRDHHPASAGEVTLLLNGGGSSLPLFQAQTAARSVSGAEMIRYFAAPALLLELPANRTRRLWLDVGGSVLALLLIWAIFLRPMLLTVAPPTMDFTDATESEFPKLDRARWDDYTAQLEALGFIRVRDVKLSNAILGGISRVLLHPQSDCYASVFQLFGPKSPGLLFGIMSYLGEDWTVGHGINKPIAGSAITRLPHRLSFSRPGMSPEQLYMEHLATRDKIAQSLGLAVVVPQGFDTYQQRSNLEAQARRDFIRNTNPIALGFRYYWAKLKPLSNDWWGDYPKEMESRTGQKFVPGEV
jgi:hypothetical protein